MCTTLEDMHVSDDPSSKLFRIARMWDSKLVPDAGRLLCKSSSVSLVDLALVHVTQLISNLSGRDTAVVATSTTLR